MKYSDTFEFCTTIKAGDPVEVISPRTGKPMSGKFTFVRYVMPDTADPYVDVRQESREVIRSFPPDRIFPTRPR